MFGHPGAGDVLDAADHAQRGAVCRMVDAATDMHPPLGLVGAVNNSVLMIEMTAGFDRALEMRIQRLTI